MYNMNYIQIIPYVCVCVCVCVWNILCQISQDPSDILAYSRAHDAEKKIHIEGRQEDLFPAPILSTGKLQPIS